MEQILCKYCQSPRVRKYGTYKGNQRYFCNDCQRKFTATDSLFGMSLPANNVASCLSMYYEGMSLNAISRQLKQDNGTTIPDKTVFEWVNKFTDKAIQETEKIHPKVGDTWIADESYVRIDRRKTDTDESADNPYSKSKKAKWVIFWDVIDADTRFLLASHVTTTRGKKDAQALMEKASERAGKVPKVIVTDKLKSYISAIEDEFGADTKHVQGSPFRLLESGESTTEIERFHRTLEQRTRIFQKYKDIDSIKLLTDGWLINYNFFKQNEGCGNIPPAQCASKIVPFKDWNDVVIPEGVADIDYEVKLNRRKTVKKGYPVYDATLTPIKKF